MTGLFTLFALTAGAPPEDERFFENRIRPLLADKCAACHGPKKQQGGLRLDSRAALLAGGDGGPVVVPGKPGESTLVKAVHQAGGLKMPPKGKLAEKEIADLERWVSLGLPWPADRTTDTAKGPAKDLWSLKPAADPPAPVLRGSHAGPWPRNPIDAFVLSKLEAKGLKPAAPAEKRTLIRRVTFDLTGLPPTPEEVESFVKDQSPGAYEKVIDRLLASPAYGERWGRHWLDLARYCDSFDARGIGGEGDCADAWRYRDWVVKAFNADTPYDTFVRMQIAGDVIPLNDAERADGIIATGLLAIGNWGGGDADKEKLLTDIVDDQIDVVGRSIMGLTLACARCHDHKFDPITTRDYYALSGIFFSTHILPNVGPKTNGPPMMRIPIDSPAEQKRHTEQEARLKAIEPAIGATAQRARAAAVARLRSGLPGLLLAIHDLGAGASDPAKLGAVAKAHGVDPRWAQLAASSIRPTPGVVLANHAPDVAGKKGLHSWQTAPVPPSFLVNATGEEARFSTIIMPAKSVAVHPGPASDVAVVWTSPVGGEVTIRGSATDFDAVCGDGFIWELRVMDGAGAVIRLTGGVVENGRREDFGKPIPIKAKVAAGDQILLVVQRRAEYSCDTTGVELTVATNDRKWDLAADWLAAPPPPSAKLGPWSVVDLGAISPLPAKAVEAARVWELARKTAADGKLDRSKLEAAAKAFADAVAGTDGIPFIPAGGEGEAFFDAKDRGELAQLRRETAAIRTELAAPKMAANGAQEGGVPGSPHAGAHDVKVHIRGRYDRLGDLLPRRFPEVISVANAPAVVSGSGRKELADWLTRPDHPLTARVIVNRVWQFHFGEGLVRTPSNFGVLGERPTHPELLDHLATWFVRNGWSLKKLHRYILLSATYRQSASGDPDTRVADPDNRLWGRYPRRRLEAEAVRDSLLAVSGDLDLAARGGPATRDFNNPRRTLYQMTIRSDRTGFGPLFDAADPTAPVDKRTVSTVAPQALFLMNHPFVKTRAKGFATRVLARAGSDADKLDFAHQLAFGRPPSEKEKAIGLDFLKAGGTTREVWEAWCHLLLQANEFVTVE
ncbi:MAG: Protein of unknown function (DUF1553)/Protein of unknown function (DUF1549)/Planctomycete [Gemmataceae bacterium]|nr:Protein of unknown function (DUF1553)/Protein of unknown function (DUF1549)/Planctomycete [Gemmataceae bacterium]